jgi:hypothetical protein
MGEPYCAWCNRSGHAASMSCRLNYEQGQQRAAANAHVTPRPIEEYHEDMGPVLWWKFPIEEPPYVGTPNDLGKEVVIEMPTVGYCTAHVDRDFSPNAMPKKTITHPGSTFFVGGWPGYHTHFTPIPLPQVPK